MQIIQVDVLVMGKEEKVRIEAVMKMIRQLSAENSGISADLLRESAPRVGNSF